MPFDIASNQILAQPASSYLQGRALRNAEDSRRAQEQRAQEDHAVNMEQSKITLGAQKAKQVYAMTEQALATGDGQRKQFVQENMPELAQQMEKNGHSWSEFDDATVTQMLQGIHAHAAGELGITPPKQFGTIKTDAGGILQQNPDTGELRQVVAPNYEPARMAETAKHDRAMESAAQQRITATGAPKGLLDDAAIDYNAQRLLNGEQPSKVLANFGRGKQGAADLAAVQNRFVALAQARGVDPEEMATKVQELGAMARTRTELGAREGRIAPRVQEAKNFAKMAVEASAAIPRGNWTDVTKVLQFGAAHTSDPKFGRFQVANNSLINAWAAAIGGGVIHVHDQQAGAQLLSTASGPEDYAARADQLIKETDAALAAPGQVMDSLHGGSLPGTGKSYKHPSGATVEILD